jgi:hypothetical protein
LTRPGITCYFLKYFEIDDSLIVTLYGFLMGRTFGRRGFRGGEWSAAVNLL